MSGEILTERQCAPSFLIHANGSSKRKLQVIPDLVDVASLAVEATSALKSGYLYNKE
jgi:hypothetical protein